MAAAGSIVSLPQCHSNATIRRGGIGQTPPVIFVFWVFCIFCFVFCFMFCILIRSMWLGLHWCGVWTSMDWSVLFTGGGQCWIGALFQVWLKHQWLDGRRPVLPSMARLYTTIASLQVHQQCSRELWSALADTHQGLRQMTLSETFVNQSTKPWWMRRRTLTRS